MCPVQCVTYVPDRSLLKPLALLASRSDILHYILSFGRSWTRIPFVPGILDAAFSGDPSVSKSCEFVSTCGHAAFWEARP